jgi:hypothetical protein
MKNQIEVLTTSDIAKIARRNHGKHSLTQFFDERSNTEIDYAFLKSFVNDGNYIFFFAEIKSFEVYDHFMKLLIDNFQNRENILSKCGNIPEDAERQELQTLCKKQFDLGNSLSYYILENGFYDDFVAYSRNKEEFRKSFKLRFEGN